MEIPMYTANPAVDFLPFIRLIEQKYGYNFNDMAGTHSIEARKEREKVRDKWMAENGYEGKQYVLDKPEGSKEDWSKDSEEMKLRIEINTKTRELLLSVERPYQNVWHWLLDNDFSCLNRGGYNSLFINEDRLLNDVDIPDFVRKFLRAIYEEAKDNPAYDGECLNCYIDW